VPEPVVNPHDPPDGAVAATQSDEAAASTQPAAAMEAADPPEPAAAAPAQPRASPPRRRRTGFRAWRRSRPFWGGLLAFLGGAEIIFTYKAPFKVILHFGLYGLAGYLVPIVMVLCGLLVVFEPQHRTFYSILEVLAALGTWLTSNLGGFIVGMLLGLIGGSLAFGWTPGERGPKARRVERRRLRRTTTQ
jgi:hypothetical protein